MLTRGIAVTLLTWSVMILEFLLCVGLFVERRYRRFLLIAGIALHAGILMLHGLVAFGFAMFGALVLFLRPVDEPFRALIRTREIDPRGTPVFRAA